ncbi:MAG: hypothetical protein WD645_03535 [Dehalococcoidia bacterium]
MKHDASWYEIEALNLLQAAPHSGAGDMFVAKAQVYALLAGAAAQAEESAIVREHLKPDHYWRLEDS